MSAIRLQKYLADAGVASRRAAEQMITEGRIRVNNTVVTVLGTRVDPARDIVEVDNRPVRPRRKLYVALNKPRGFLCTRRDPEERRVVSELLPKEWGNLHTVGRLDRDSEGLLLLTNDGEFSLRLTHPRYGIRKRYRVLITGRFEEADLVRLTDGIEDEGEMLKAERAWLVSANNSHSTLEIELAEGRNREIRRLLAALGYEVEMLRRVQIGSLRLGELPVGRWRVLTPVEVKSLLPSRG